MITPRIFRLAALMGILLLVACAGPEATPTPERLVTIDAPDGDSATSDAAWSRIQDEGTLVVGTSADYPPFAFFNDRLQLEGFDVALMREIGALLGVDVMFRDLAFDGLGNALLLEQIDVAAAAISITPEREAVVDFSQVYYVGEDAILAAADSTLDIDTAADMRGLRIGVQQGSVYQDWVEDTLVAPGLIDAGDLFVYIQAPQAIRDLVNGRIDLFMLDLRPAEIAAAQAGVTIVGQGLNPQRLAVAVPPNEPTLLNAINQALAQLQAEGRLVALAETYLNLSEDETIPPPSEPQPTLEPPTPVPAPCIDGMALVEELTRPAQNINNPPLVEPGQAFRKGWRVRNLGTCTWDSTYALAFAAGNTPAAQMGGTAVAVQGEVAPGQTYDFFISLQAPQASGTYVAFWEMRNGAGAGFGERLWVGVTVPTPSPPTALPTQPPSSSILFTVDNANLNAGECATFRWDVRNVRAVYFYPVGQPWQQYPVPTQGSSTQCPPQTTAYELRVVKLDGNIETRQIRVTVTPVERAPRIETFNVAPGGQITAGSCVRITWQVSGDVTSVRLRRNEATLWQNAPLQGRLDDCPPAGVASYVIEVSGPAGNSRLQQNVNVAAPPPRPEPSS